MNAHPTGLSESSQAVAVLRSRVLVAEDDPMVRRILQTWLQQWNHGVIAVDNGAAAWKVLQQKQPPKLLILDWMMPEIDGLELCRRIRADQRSAYRYILLITAKDARQDLVSAFDAGADDYLTKPFDCDELRARLRVGERILKLQDDLVRARDALQFQATHDLLTGLWNRGAVLDVLNRELERCWRTRVPMAVLMLDLDHFKRINDTHGHLTGDAVLKETATRLTRAVRSYDCVGRYGGEEFLVVLPGCSSTQAVRIAERIRSRIAQDPVGTGGAGLQLSASIGGAMVATAAGSANEILALADSALYQAKNAGRDRTVIL